MGFAGIRSFPLIHFLYIPARFAQRTKTPSEPIPKTEIPILKTESFQGALTRGSDAVRPLGESRA
jgi:hypothetical protein